MLGRLLLLLLRAGFWLVDGQGCVELGRWWPLRLGLFDLSNRLKHGGVLGRVSLLHLGASLVPDSNLGRRSA